MVKVTGGQRLDLFGIKKEDLPAVWADLNAAGMVSGHAYAKALRTVKTCVGTDWCRFGTQDSTGLGVKIEKFMWGSLDAAQVQDRRLRLPAQLRRGDHQGLRRHLRRQRLRAPRRRHGGIHIRVTDCSARSRPRPRRSGSSAPSSSFTARKRWYLERISTWMERVGLDCIKAAVSRTPTTAPRSVRPLLLFAALLPGRSWAERVAGRDSRRVQPTQPPLELRPHERARPRSASLDRCRRGRPTSRSRGARHGADAAGRRSPSSAPATDEVFALIDRCPHKGGPLSQGIVHGTASPARCTTGRSRWRPASPWAPTGKGCAPVIPLRVEDGRLLLGLGCADGGRDGQAPPAPIAASAAASRRRRTAARSQITGDPAHPANLGRLCSKGTHWARRSAWRAACCTR